MINLKWSILDSADAISFRVYRSLIGFEFPVENSEGKTISLKINNKLTVNFTIGIDPTACFNNTSSGQLFAALSEDKKNVIVRNSLRTAPGSIQIMRNTLGLQNRTVSYLSEDKLVGTVMANESKDYLFTDVDGSISDNYALVVINSAGDESKKSAYRTPVSSSGDICCICGVITNLSGKRVVDAVVKAFICVPPESSLGAMITKEPIEVMSDMDGRFSLPVLQGSLIKLEIDVLNYGKVVKVPNKSFVQIGDLEIDGEYQFDPKSSINL